MRAATDSNSPLHKYLLPPFAKHSAFMLGYKTSLEQRNELMRHLHEGVSSLFCRQALGQTLILHFVLISLHSVGAYLVHQPNVLSHSKQRQ